MTKPTLIVYSHKSTLAQASAQRMLLAILDAFGTEPSRTRVDVALTGGSDTIGALQQAAKNPLIEAIDWSRVHVWWGDERFVAADDPDRNALQARDALLGRLVDAGRLPERNIHEMPAGQRPAEQITAAQQASPANLQHTDALLDAKAREYEQELTAELGDEPTFDLALLGMGPDGHFASLFPEHTEITITDRLVVGVSHSPKLPPLRLSLTAPVLARTRRTWFLTAGTSKSVTLAHVFATPNNPEYPASFGNGTEEYVWFTDAAAASQIDH